MRINVKTTFLVSILLLTVVTVLLIVLSYGHLCLYEWVFIVKKVNDGVVQYKEEIANETFFFDEELDWS
jgi:hypothetical protein